MKRDEIFTMISELRDKVCNLLTSYFKLVPVPASFSDIRQSPASFLVVYRYQSVYFEALIRSFALRSGINCHYARNLEDPQLHSLLFCALEDIPHLKPEITRGRDFITMNVIRGRGPIRTTPKYSLNAIDIACLLCGPILQRFLLLFSFGKPLSLEIDSSRLSSRQLQRQLKLDFYRNIRVVRGTPFQSREVQSQIVLSGDDFHREINSIVERSKIPLSLALKQARKEFFRIAASPRTLAYVPAAIISHILIKRLFAGLSVKGLEQFSEATRRDPVVLVPLHRSHLDYVLMGYVLYKASINPPLVAAGINLSFWPAGRIIRSLGGYFVKRDARNDRIHGLVLRRYVTYLLKRGHLQEFFIEGGRSRSGAMRFPKLGLLKIFFQALSKGARRDVLFVPVSITYENVIEDTVYAEENSGQAKVKENLSSLVRARKFLKNKYGEVSIRFGEAISLSDYLAKANSGSATSKKSVLDFGLLLTKRIQDGTSISLTSLLYTTLMSAPHYGLTESRYRALLSNFLQNALISEQVSTGQSELTPQLKHFLEYPEQSLHHFTDRLLIKHKSYIDQEFYFIPGKFRFTADFYRNSILHLFLPSTLLAISELAYESTADESVEKVFEIFRHSFFFSDWQSLQSAVERTRSGLRERGLLNDNSFIRRVPGLFTPELLLAAIQSLLWTLEHIEQLITRSHPITENELLKIMQTNAETGKYAGALTATEAASRTHLENSLTTLKKLKYLESDRRSRLMLRKDPSDFQKLLAHLNQEIVAWQFSHLGQFNQQDFGSTALQIFQVH